ncbi:MAG: hypothetical protein MJZ74_08320 [Muribaculaceae bacterium]|nr:hypothetical protein [Muribaculaceae bacterium]
MKNIAFLVAALMAITAAAQDTGMWKSHPKYIASGSQNLIDTKEFVYFQSSNHLFGYNKTTGEVGPKDKDNGTSDMVVTHIYHNYDADYTLVTYNNSNIDVLRADGSVVNIPDIKDAIYNGKKGINNVSFANGKMYMATEFGLVIADDATLQVTDTYYYGKSLTSAIQVGDILFASFEDELYYDTRKNHDDFSQWTNTMRTVVEPHFYAVNSSRFFMACNGELNMVDIEMEDPETPTLNVTLAASGAASSIQRTPQGFVAVFPTAGYSYTFDEDGSNATRQTVEKGYVSCHPSSDGTIWVLGASGLHKMGETKYVTPNGWGISQNAFYSTYNPGNGKVYVNRACDNAINKQYNPSKPEIWSYDGNLWCDVTPVGAPTNDYANYWLVFEPGQTCSYFYSTRSKNIVHVVNDTVKQIHTASNSPLTHMNALRIDKDGNLWGVQSYNKVTTNPYVIALPKDKLNAAPAKDNWVTPNIDGNRGTNKRASLAIAKGSDVKVFTAGDYNNPIIIWDNGGDVHNLNPRTASFNNLPDTDGATIGWQMMRCLAPDTMGNVWASTTSGILYFNPAEAWDPDFKVHRVKIKSSTNGESDYLLDGEDVYCVAVDSLNRKWLGTATQGVYLISSDNKEILAQFDASNSALPSNTIYSICPKPNTNSVIFVTSEGIAEYFYEAPKGEESYDNISVFPNPVKPDFTGYVTINGLLKNSIVKITDRKGNTVAQIQAQGTSVKWDACNPATGERLKTGVYNVYAGTSEETMSQQPYTRIHIIK